MPRLAEVAAVPAAKLWVCRSCGKLALIDGTVVREWRQSMKACEGDLHWWVRTTERSLMTATAKIYVDWWKLYESGEGCAVNGCDGQRSQGELMCESCWNLLPERTQCRLLARIKTRKYLDWVRDVVSEADRGGVGGKL